MQRLLRYSISTSLGGRAFSAKVKAKKVPVMPVVQQDEKLLEQSIEKALQDSRSHWDAQKAVHEANLRIIEAELSQDPENADLMAQANSLKKLLVSKDVDYKVEERYTQGKVQAVDIKLIKDMSNDEYDKWKDLVCIVGDYYHVFFDLFGKKSKEVIPEGKNLINLKVNFSERKIGNMKEYQKFFVSRGNIIDPSVTSKSPRVKFCSNSDDKRLFTLALIDMDTPCASKKTMVPTPLWLVSNISADKQSCSFNGSTEIIQYTPPHPVKGTGFHRYAWTLFSQPQKLELKNVRNSLKETNYDFSEYLKKSHLTLEALSFHKAAWSDAVTQLYQNGITLPREIVQWNSEVSGKSEFIKVIEEPIFGKLLNRDWKEVTRKLYKYAFQ